MVTETAAFGAGSLVDVSLYSDLSAASQCDEMDK